MQLGQIKKSAASKTVVLLSCLSIFAYFISSTHAGPITYTIDPQQSQLTVSGSVNGSPFTAQSTNSNITRYSGTIQADRGASSIQFLAGSAITATLQANTNLSPDRNAQTTFEPVLANYGIQAPLAPMTDPVDTTTGYFTFFDLILGTTSSSISVNSGSFLTTGITGQFTSGLYAYIRYGDLFENIPDSGHPTLVGNSSINTGAAGSLIDVGNLEALTLPINLTITSNNADGINSTFTFTGNIVATAIVPEPASLGVVAVGLAMLLNARRARRLGK